VADQCENGHGNPRGLTTCMYCGARIAGPAAPAPSALAVPPPSTPPPAPGGSGRLARQIVRTLLGFGVAAAVILGAIFIPPALFDDDPDRPEVPSQRCERDTDDITIAVLAWHARAADPEPGKEVAPWPISIDELREKGLLDDTERLHALEGDGFEAPTIVKLPNACPDEHLLQIG
jgi:hypothetical protein